MMKVTSVEVLGRSLDVHARVEGKEMQMVLTFPTLARLLDELRQKWQAQPPKPLS